MNSISTILDHCEAISMSSAFEVNDVIKRLGSHVLVEQIGQSVFSRERPLNRRLGPGIEGQLAVPSFRWCRRCTHNSGTARGRVGCLTTSVPLSALTASSFSAAGCRIQTPPCASTPPSRKLWITKNVMRVHSLSLVPTPFKPTDFLKYRESNLPPVFMRNCFYQAIEWNTVSVIPYTH